MRRILNGGETMSGLMRQRDMMEFMKVSRSTLWRIMRHEDFPKPVVLMGLKRWRREEIETWLRSRQDETAVCMQSAG
jgi:predicted DNA-binding transcriptional regulator AlpA